MRPIVAAVPLALLALAGCGQSGSGDAGAGKFEGAEKPVAQVIADLAEDGRKNDPQSLCRNLISQELEQRIESAGTTCPKEMRRAIRDADGFDLTVKDVKIQGGDKGTIATVEVEGTDGGKKTTRTFTLRRDGDDWKIQKFAT